MSKPTKLEEEMFFAIHGFGPMDGGNTAGIELERELQQQAKAAAQVALQWIEKGMKAASNFTMNEGYWHTGFPEIWMRENGLTPSEPLKENT